MRPAHATGHHSRLGANRLPAASSGPRSRHPPPAPVSSGLIMARRGDQSRTHLADLLGDRAGWRLEPRTTPGASPLWCYVDTGQVELSVTAERDGVHLYIMDNDRELLFEDAKGSNRGYGHTGATRSTRPLPPPPVRSGSASSSSGVEPGRRVTARATTAWCCSSTGAPAPPTTGRTTRGCRCGEWG